MNVHPNITEAVKLTPIHYVCKIGRNTAQSLGYGLLLLANDLLCFPLSSDDNSGVSFI